MPVAEIEPERVIAHLFPSDDGDSRKGGRSLAAILLAEDVTLALVLRAWRGGAELFAREIAFPAIAPGDGELIPDELNVGRCDHEKLQTTGAGVGGGR